MGPAKGRSLGYQRRDLKLELRSLRSRVAEFAARTDRCLISRTIMKIFLGAVGIVVEAEFDAGKIELADDGGLVGQQGTLQARERSRSTSTDQWRFRRGCQMFQPDPNARRPSRPGKRCSDWAKGWPGTQAGRGSIGLRSNPLRQIKFSKNSIGICLLT